MIMIVLALDPLSPRSSFRLDRRKIKFNTTSDTPVTVANNQIGVLGVTMNSEMQIPINAPLFTNAIFFHVLIADL
jgi:hypothetical protein